MSTQNGWPDCVAHLRDNELMRALEDPEAQQGGTHFFSFGHLANATVYSNCSATQQSQFSHTVN